jgi:hypothetical protein
VLLTLDDNMVTHSGYSGTKEEINQKQRDYYNKNRTRILEQRKKYRDKNYSKNKIRILTDSKKYYENNKEKCKLKRHERYIRDKDINSESYQINAKTTKETSQKITEILNLLDNKCSNPYNLNHGDFIADIRCLQIDHINCGGCKEVRKKGKSYLRVVLEKIKSGSKDYQLLCANCNWIKRYENKEVRH